MGGGYTKLFSGIVLSSVWAYDDQTRIVWLTMLALADKDGTVTTSVSGLAHVARVSVEATRRALEIFVAPDPDSSTKDEDGRRIVAIDRGWRLLNHGKFRRMMTREEKKAQDAERIAAKRAAEKQTIPDVSPTVAKEATKSDAGDSPASASASETQSGSLSSGSESGTLKASVPDPEARAIPGGTEPEWSAEDWRVRFCKAYEATGKGAFTNGGPGAHRQLGNLAAMLAKLTPVQRRDAQRRAPEIFAEYLADQSRRALDERHGFGFFVVRFDRLIVPRAADPARAGPAYGQPSTATREAGARLLARLEPGDQPT